ncbi:type 2 lanthipeptide synthetase LanM family protein [Anabaena cylindrica UHCC 0172]|uniref:type 2 lanthipeptide synthetase LanM family protein n=1 Tax=Anabaena cylindrica TaxID=1165 RepID=UPI002B201AD4|nr:type 2 lanthipeptide synthetase LanM family protein [Anabaena cylindrica]MEA5552683.1 type 2 lanthipeptide synthetase LanM family protein [Anabaena cylindrica UHCC 0172]
MTLSENIKASNSPPSTQSEAWYHALTLTERITFLNGDTCHTPNKNIDGKLAKHLIERWRSQFSTGKLFEQRLTVDGINENEFLELLGEPINAVRDRCSTTPAWLECLSQAYARPMSFDAVALLQQWDKQPEVGFLYVIEPLLRQGIDHLRQGIQKLEQAHSSLPFDPNTIEAILLTDWSQELLHLLNRTLVLELNVARLQGLLEGDTPQERFESFIQRLRHSDVAFALLEEYPVLARQLLIHIHHLSSFCLEFLTHLCQDWPTLANTLGTKTTSDKLLQLEGNLGDKHRGGRSVLMATFSSGWKVVYKPKSLGIDVHFQELLSWLNQQGDHPTLRTLKVINRGSYGWVEFIKAEDCHTTIEIERFYERQGAYLAILYALSATDFHFENLIAVGEHPVLLDLEAMFHPPRERRDESNTEQLVVNKILQSVLKVGLLPMRLWFNSESEGLDISGLGATGGQLSPEPLPYWEGAGTDQMQLKSSRFPLKEGDHRPKLPGKEVRLLDYIPSLINGFTVMYQLLMKHRDYLLSDSGPLAAFREDEVRVILRPTRFYGMLLHESFHPDVLRNALNRDRLWDQLWSEVKNDSDLIRVIFAEREDLDQGDIPAFHTYPGSCHLWSSSGKRIANFFDASTMSSPARRLHQFSGNDLAQQTWYIRATLATTVTGDELKHDSVSRPTISHSSNTVAVQSQFLAAALAVGDRLESLAIQGGGDATWVGIELVDQRNWMLVSSGIDLYTGLPGIMLFLAYLGAVTHQERYTVLAQSAMKTLRQQVQQVQKVQSVVTSIGAFTGWSGLIYTLTHLGVLWEQPELIAEAEQTAALLPSLIEYDQQFDVIGGAAGCLVSLINLHHHAPSALTLQTALQCGDWLLAHAQPMNRGLAWVANGFSKSPLSGFSHGAGGIAWSLLKLYQFTGEERFQTAARQAIEFERSLFCREEGNWFDRREAEVPEQGTEKVSPKFMTAWCNGAPGVGLARLHCLPYFDDSQIRGEINTALKTTLDHGFGGNHSLCHGDLGNLELLLQTSITLDDPQWKTEVDRLAAMILANIEKEGWLCGVPFQVETPGLMTGLAGIGYGLLRLAAPKLVPSVLALEPPKVNSRV